MTGMLLTLVLAANTATKDQCIVKCEGQAAQTETVALNKGSGGGSIASVARSAEEQRIENAKRDCIAACTK